MRKLFFELIDDMVWPLLWVMGMWLVFFIDTNYTMVWTQWGIQPRSIKGLVGILASPFLHGDFEHLFSNSVPFIVAGGFIYYFFPQIRKSIMLRIYVIAGFLVWLIADQPSNHIGASGMVYGMIAFLITHGVINKNKNMLGVTLILVFLYGGLIYGIFPDYGFFIGKNISWEGHLFGMLTGIGLGFFYREQGPQKLSYEDEYDDDDDDDDFFDKDLFDQEDFKINYHYKNNK